MTNKPLMIISVLSIIAIIFSSGNSYLLFITPGIEKHDQNRNAEYTAIDIIIAIDNIRIIDWAGYVSENVSPNQTVKLIILRSSQTISLEITTTIIINYFE